MVDPTASDRELLQAFVSARDEQAFAVLVKRHQEMMRSVAYRICGDSQDAMDAMQRAVIAFARRAGELKVHDVGIGPWLQLRFRISLQSDGADDARPRRLSRERSAGLR